MFTGKPRYKEPDILWGPLEKDISPLRREEKDVYREENMGFGFVGVGIFGFSLAAYSVVATLVGFNTTVNGITVGVLMPLFVVSGLMG